MAPAAQEMRMKKAPLMRGLQICLGVVLLSHANLRSIIDDGGLNCRVRNGVGCTPSSRNAKTNSYNLELTGGKESSTKQAARTISTGQLNASPHLHLRPIHQVVSLGPSALSRGELILRLASRLDAFSGYPFRT